MHKGDTMVEVKIVNILADNNQSHSVFKFSLYFREDRDSEIAPTEERLEHQMRTTGQLNGSVTTTNRL